MIGNRLLLVTSERIGDVIFCTPAIKLLREYKPAAVIDVLALSSAAASVLTHNPAINHIYIATEKKLPKELPRHYDAILDLHNSRLTRHYCQILQLPTFSSPRGIAGQHQSIVASEFIASLINSPLPETQNYCLYPQAEHYNKIETLLKQQQVNIAQHILIGCHMGTNRIVRQRLKFWKRQGNHKDWPVQKFVELEARLRQQNPHIRFVLTGSAAEAKLGKKFMRYSPDTINLIGQTSVLDLAALMRFCKVFLTGDTGPLHIASAMTTPLVTLFGPTSPQETGPYPPHSNQRVIEAPDRNMEKIATAEVFVALTKMLN